MGDDDLHGSIVLEGDLAREHLDEHAGQPVDVAPPVELLAHDLLRAHVGRSAADRTILGDRHVGVQGPHLGHAEIDDLHQIRLAMSSGHQKNVLGFQVSMDDPPGVGVVNGLAHLAHDRDRFGEADRTMDGHSLAQRPALEELHDEKKLTVTRLPEVEERDDIRMCETAGALCFLVETLHGRLVLCRGRRDQLQRDLSLHRVLERTIDDTHPSASEHAEQRVPIVDTRTDSRVPRALYDEHFPPVDRADLSIDGEEITAGRTDPFGRFRHSEASSPEE